MPCVACGDEVVDASVPDAIRQYAPDGAASISLCTRCLTVDSGADPRADADEPDFSRVSDAFPTRHEPAVALALVIHHCDSLVTNRAAIETLLEDVERAGVDPLLTIDRLLADPSVEPAVDLERRRHKLEDLLY